MGCVCWFVGWCAVPFLLTRPPAASRCCQHPVAVMPLSCAMPRLQSRQRIVPQRNGRCASRTEGHGHGSQGMDGDKDRTHISPEPKDRLHTGWLSMLVSVSYLLLRLLTLLHYSLHCSLYCFCMNSAYIPATWIPHSVFGRPFHLPSRSSSPSATGCVECQSPTDL